MSGPSEPIVVRLADQRGRFAIECQDKPKSLSDINYLSNRLDDQFDAIHQQIYDVGVGARTAVRMMEPRREGFSACSRSFTQA